MSFTVNVFYRGAAGRHSPAVARNWDELEIILADIEAHPQTQPPVFVAEERPKFGPLGDADHRLKIDIDAVHRVGALHYVGPAPDVPQGFDVDAWISRAASPVDRALSDALALYIDRDTRTEYPADAIVPLADVHRALREFQDTGERPTCIGWQTTDVW